MVIGQEVHRDGIVLNLLDCNGLDNEPKVSYKTILRGQGVYLLNKCKELGVRVIYQSGHVLIFTKKKIDLFLDAIEQSLHESQELPTKSFIASHQCFKSGKKLLAIGIKDLDLLITTDDNFKDVVFYQFKNKIPITKNVKIYSTLRDLKTGVEKEFNLIV
jgi:hypothetical protein